MLLQPRQDNFTNNMNSNNINLRPHHHDDNRGAIFPKCSSPRPCQRSKVPPNITICPPGDNNVMASRFLNREKLDNDVFQSQASQTSFLSYTEDKQEVYSGKLYIIRNTGSPSSPASSPTRSPVKSPSRSSSTVFRSSPTSCAQQWSPHSSPTSCAQHSSPHSSSTSCAQHSSSTSCAQHSSPTSCAQHSSPTSSPTSPRTRKTAVTVRVYRCNHDHFAVISRDMLYPGKPIFVNLRHSRVMPGQTLGRFVVAGKSDSGHVIEFEAPELSSLSQWLDAFQVSTPPASPNRIVGGCGVGLASGTPPIPRSPALPTLTETDED